MVRSTIQHPAVTAERPAALGALAGNARDDDTGATHLSSGSRTVDVVGVSLVLAATRSTHPAIAASCALKKVIPIRVTSSDRAEPWFVRRRLARPGSELPRPLRTRLLLQC